MKPASTATDEAYCDNKISHNSNNNDDDDDDDERCWNGTIDIIVIITENQFPVIFIRFWYVFDSKMFYFCALEYFIAVFIIIMEHSNEDNKCLIRLFWVRAMQELSDL